MTTTRGAILNEAFKRFQRLPDWPLADTGGIQQGRMVEEDKPVNLSEMQLPLTKAEPQFVNVLTG